jgi:hypothetical protein
VPLDAYVSALVAYVRLAKVCTIFQEPLRLMDRRLLLKNDRTRTRLRADACIVATGSRRPTSQRTCVARTRTSRFRRWRNLRHIRTHRHRPRRPQAVPCRNESPDRRHKRLRRIVARPRNSGPVKARSWCQISRRTRVVVALVSSCQPTPVR